MNFIAILLIVFVNYIGLGLVYPIFATLLFDPSQSLIDADASQALRGMLLGLLISLTPLTQFLSSPLLGSFSDLYGRRLILLAGSLTGSLGYFLAVIGIWNNSIILLLLYRICVGISEGTVGVAQASIADISSEENKGHRFSLVSASAGVGFMIGPFIGGKLIDTSVADWFGYDIPFLVALVMSMIGFLCILCMFPETKKKTRAKPFCLKESVANIGKVFLWPQLQWLFFGAFALAFGWSFFNEFIPVFLKERFAYTPSEVGDYYAYGGAWYAFSTGIGIAPLLKRFPSEQLITKAAFGSAAAMLAFLIIPEAWMIWWILPPFMYLLALSFPTTAALVSNRAGVDNQGEVMGVYQSVWGAAMGVSPLLLGTAVGAFPSMTAWGGALAMAFAGAAFWKTYYVDSPVVSNN